MSDAPEVHSTTRVVYRELGSGLTHDDELADWNLLRLVDAYVRSTVGEADDLVRGADGWAWVLDPDETPERFLPWLAQFAGARLTRGLTVEQQRERITDNPALRRGTPGAIEAAAREHLTGDRLVNIEERTDGDGNPEPYHFAVTTFEAETPNPDAVEAALRDAKPAGLVLHYSVETGWTWGDAVDEHATWQDVVTSYADWDEFIAVVPPEE